MKKLTGTDKSDGKGCIGCNSMKAIDNGGCWNCTRRNDIDNKCRKLNKIRLANKAEKK